MKNALRDERWAVLGSTGFVGKAICEQLESAGVSVVRLSAPRVTFNPQKQNVLPMLELARIHPAVNSLKESLKDVDVVVNAAGIASPDGHEKKKLFGANSLLPAIVAEAARRAHCSQFIHISSAAVQGYRKVLDVSREVAPFSAYSQSKALGETGVLPVDGSIASLGNGLKINIIRATSVQGNGRATTKNLRRIARSPMSSVAFPGNFPTVVSSIDGLAQFVVVVGVRRETAPPILLQPNEGLTVSQVLTLAGDSEPLQLPKWFCAIILALGRPCVKLMPRTAGAFRRLQLMWLGQAQEPNPAGFGLANGYSKLAEILTSDGDYE